MMNEWQDSHERHDHYLDELVRNFNDVDEDVDEMRWIMKDGIWMKKGSGKRFKLCDLIICYYDETMGYLELKGSTNQRSKAKKQLESAEKLASEALSIPTRHMKIVYYTNGKYSYEFYEGR